MDTDAIYHAPSHHELVYVGPGGTTTQCFGYQPTTDDMADYRRKDRFCVQLVGEQYEVYDLRTMRQLSGFGAWTVGIPVFVNADPDAAIMWALMNQ